MKLLFIFLPAISLLGSITTKAQSFTVLMDTIYVGNAGHVGLYMDRVASGASPITYSWQVINSTIPDDWTDPDHISALCDNSYCRYLTSLWPSGIRDSTFQYPVGDTGVLSLYLNLPATASSGCYYLTVRLRSANSYTDHATETWCLCKDAIAGSPEIEKPDEYRLYPNPIQHELHFSGNQEINKIELCNILGEQLKAGRCENGVAVINTDDLPRGIYLARLTGGDGTITVLRKVVKE